MPKRRTLMTFPERTIISFDSLDYSTNYYFLSLSGETELGVDDVFYIPREEIARFGTDYPVLRVVFRETGSFENKAGRVCNRLAQVTDENILRIVTEAWCQDQRGEYRPGEKRHFQRLRELCKP